MYKDQGESLLYLNVAQYIFYDYIFHNKKSFLNLDANQVSLNSYWPQENPLIADLSCIDKVYSTKPVYYSEAHTRFRTRSNAQAVSSAPTLVYPGINL